MSARPKRDHNGRRLPTARADGVVGDGLLLRDGEQIEQGVFDSALHPDVEAQINGYVPMKSPWRELWPLIRAFVVRIVLAVRPPTVQSSRHSMIAVTRLAGWAVQEGLELDEEVLFHPLRIEEFTAWATDFDTPFRSNLRARLRASAGHHNNGPVAPGAHTLGTSRAPASLHTAGGRSLECRHRPAVQRHPACGGGSPPRGPGDGLEGQGDPSSDG